MLDTSGDVDVAESMTFGISGEFFIPNTRFLCEVASNWSNQL